MDTPEVQTATSAPEENTTSSPFKSWVTSQPGGEEVLQRYVIGYGMVAPQKPAFCVPPDHHHTLQAMDGSISTYFVSGKRWEIAHPRSSRCILPKARFCTISSGSRMSR